jgi:hypothetical protein
MLSWNTVISYPRDVRVRHHLHDCEDNPILFVLLERTFNTCTTNVVVNVSTGAGGGGGGGVGGGGGAPPPPPGR